MDRDTLPEIVAGFLVLLATGLFLAYGLSQAPFGRTAGLRLNAEFDDAGALAAGSDVRLAGVKIGSVTATGIDRKTYRARVDFVVAPGIALPSDSSAQIASAGLLGGVSLDLVPGGATDDLRDGQTIRLTQSAANLESLLGKFIFNVGNLADASQRQLQRVGAPTGGMAK